MDVDKIPQLLNAALADWFAFSVQPDTILALMVIAMTVQPYLLTAIKTRAPTFPPEYIPATLVQTIHTARHWQSMDKTTPQMAIWFGPANSAQLEVPIASLALMTRNYLPICFASYVMEDLQSVLHLVQIMELANPAKVTACHVSTIRDYQVDVEQISHSIAVVPTEWCALHAQKTILLEWMQTATTVPRSQLTASSILARKWLWESSTVVHVLVMHTTFQCLTMVPITP